MRDTAEFLAARLADPGAQWSLGTFGAIAEFARDPDEPVTLDLAGPDLSAVTGRGGIRMMPSRVSRLFASESATQESWSQIVALCRPADDCAMAQRKVLTELGPDDAALRQEDRDAVLFDLGFGALQADCCVRVADPALLATLRACAGRAVFEPGNPAMAAIVPASPHRVFLSRVGRIEVYQRIPPAHGKSPEGPHTHVLPKLIARRRTHPATQPVPQGLVPCAHCYPEHPAKDARGHPRPFDRAAHDAFQAMLRHFGDREMIALKERVRAAVEAAENPAAVTAVNNRFGRAGIRIALRQLAAAGAPAAALAAWQAAHEASQREAHAADPYAH